MKKEIVFIIAASLLILVSISLAFLVENIWIAFFAAFFVAAIYLILLDKWVVQKLDNSNHKKIIRTLLALLIVFQLYSGVMNTFRSNIQQDTLKTIRTYIDSSIAQIEVEKNLLAALRYYYHTSDDEEKTLENSFKTIMGNQLKEDGTISFKDTSRVQELDFIYDIVNEDSIIVYVSAQVGQGVDSEYKNLNSKSGKYEAKGILTPKGVDYERTN